MICDGKDCNDMATYCNLSMQLNLCEDCLYKSGMRDSPNFKVIE